MGTRSAIGYQLPSGRIKAVYCHWDGYPKHHLPILIEHYNTLEKVKALIKPGSMSSLRTSETWDGGPDRKPQPLYHHERGNGPWNSPNSDYHDPPHVNASIKAAINWWRDSCCEHMYIFEADVGWIHYDLNKPEPKPKFTKTQELLSSLL